jgi:uncharacterized membrane protein YbhN (UPF0104 family)
MTETQKRSRPKWKNIVSTALFLVLLGLLVWYVREHWAEMKKLLDLSPGTVAALFALGLASCVFNCLYHLQILNTYNLKLSLTDWMGVVCLSNVIAFVLPMRADLVFKATYYKRVKGLSYTKSASIVAGNAVFGVAFSLIQIIIGLLCMGWIDGQWPVLLWVLTAASTVGLLFFLWLSGRAESRLRERLAKVKAVNDIIAGFNALIRNKGLLWRLLIYMTGGILVRLFLNIVCFQAAGLPVTLYEALFYSSVSWLASVVAVVPGNLGLRESVMGAATLALGALFSEGVAASLLNRVAMMFVYIFMGLIFALPVLRRFNHGKGSLAFAGKDEGGSEAENAESPDRA